MFSHQHYKCTSVTLPMHSFCLCLSCQKKVVVQTAAGKKDVTFRKVLLNRCQQEFEKEKSAEKRINEKMEKLVGERLSVSACTCRYLLFKFLLND